MWKQFCIKVCFYILFICENWTSQKKQKLTVMEMDYLSNFYGIKLEETEARMNELIQK